MLTRSPPPRQPPETTPDQCQGAPIVMHATQGHYLRRRAPPPPPPPLPLPSRATSTAGK